MSENAGSLYNLNRITQDVKDTSAVQIKQAEGYIESWNWKIILVRMAKELFHPVWEKVMVQVVLV